MSARKGADMERGKMVRRLGLIALLLGLMLAIVPLSGCGMSDADILQWIKNYLAQNADSEDQDGEVALALTYPVGRSPKVFVSGWVFGASCVIDGKDYSDQVQWSGTGTFNSAVGARSRPVFNGPGSNTITLSVTVNGKTTSKSFSVEAVSTDGYACVGMMAFCPADAHGDPGDPHPVTGPITTGSSNVFINGKAAARSGDTGVHAACSGPNTFTIVGGDSEVLINGKPAARIGSQTRHCGGMGTIVGFRE